MNIGEGRWSVLVVKMVHYAILKKGKKCMGNEITIEEKKKKVRDFRPIDDAFFEVLADDTGFCQEMLRILLLKTEKSVMWKCRDRMTMIICAE